MKKYGVFDILGPIMIGPSSSHTAGAVRIAKIARRIAGPGFTKVRYHLHGSFKLTYQGHGTDKALVAGSLGMDTDDENIRNSFEIAKQQGLEFEFLKKNLGDVHPNTVRVQMIFPDGHEVNVMGSSIGGGNVEINRINDVDLTFNGNFPTIILKYAEQKGIIAFVSTILSSNNYNLESMKTIKTDDVVTLVVELDHDLDMEIGKEILDDERFFFAKYIPSGV